MNDLQSTPTTLNFMAGREGELGVSKIQIPELHLRFGIFSLMEPQGIKDDEIEPDWRSKKDTVRIPDIKLVMHMVFVLETDILGPKYMILAFFKSFTLPGGGGFFPKYRFFHKGDVQSSTSDVLG